MSFNGNGTSQYFNLAAGTDIYRTRPFTVAAHFDTAGFVDGNNYGFISDGSARSTLNSGWRFWKDGNNVLSFAFARTTAAINTLVSTQTILAGTGWWTCAAVTRTNGANSLTDLFLYRHNTATLTVESGKAGTGSPIAPNADDPVLLGAMITTTTSATRWHKGLLGWVAVFAGDLGNTGSSTAPGIWELIARGPWGMLDSNCKLFVPFSNAAQDFGASNFAITGNGTPVYAGSGITEVFTLDVIPVTHQPGAITGTLSSTLGALTDSATGTVLVTGTSAPTLAALTASTAAAVAVTGSATPILAALSSTTAAAVLVQGSLSDTLDAVTASAAAGVLAQATLNATLAALTSTTAAAVFIAGTLSSTLGALTDATAAVVLVQATLTKTLDALTSTTAGGVLVQGTTSSTLDALTLSATGTVGTATATGDLSSTLDALTDSATGTVLVTGSATPTLAALTDSGAGAVAVSGSATPALGALTDSGAGTVLDTGSGNNTLGAATTNATATVLVTGSASKTLDALTVSASGGAGTTFGDLNKTLANLTGSASGTVLDSGSQNNTLAAASVAASGTVSVGGSLSSTLGGLTSSAAAAIAVQASLARILGSVTVSANGLVLSEIFGNLNATLAALVAASSVSVGLSPHVAIALMDRALANVVALDSPASVIHGVDVATAIVAGRDVTA